MARPKSSNPPLKEELSVAAYAVVHRGGADKLTVRAIAAEADVSANALYLYYPGGVSELLASVAIRGFNQLRSALGGAAVSDDPPERVRELMFRYVRFGVENASLYRAMFHASLSVPLERGDDDAKGQATYAALRELKAFAYADLVAPLEKLHDTRALRGDQDPWGAPGLALAALAHGLVGEFIDEGLLLPVTGTPEWNEDRRTMTSAVTEMLMHGMLKGSLQGGGQAFGAMESMRPQDDHRWKLYGQTILEFFPGNHALSIDLRATPTETTRERMSERGLPDSFVVLTACNPRGRTVDDEENRLRTLQLKAALRERNQIWLPVDGVSPDGRHREESVAVVLSRLEARAIAREFEQSAFFAYKDSFFWLEGALVEAPRVRLPSE
jgi:AcrR family transcriptional regulator